MIFIALPALARVPFEEAASTVAKHFRNWEILGEGTLALESIKDRFEDVVSSYDLKRIQLHAPFSDLNIGSYREDVRSFSVETLRRNIGIAADLGIEHVTVHPGVFSPHTFGMRDFVISQTNRSLRELSPVVRDRGIAVSLENMPRIGITVGHTPDELLRMIEGTEIGICLDLGHANTTGNISAFLELLPDIRNIHIHDNMGERDEHLPLGEGNIDFEGILKTLSSGYSHGLVIEAEESIDSGVRSLEFLKKRGVSPD